MATAAASEEALARASRFLVVGVDENGTGEVAPILDFLGEVEPLGVILFARNIPDADQLLALNSAIAHHYPELILFIDHEGGRVDRMPAPFTHFAPALDMARAGDPGLLRDVARFQARELRAAGFHANFAPVLDIHTNPDNPIIGDRAFGTTPEEVIHNALPYMQGLAEGGIVGCGKHFPGHGDTTCDSHLELPHVDQPADRLHSVEMRPFARAIAQGVPMIMTAHVVYHGLDAERPASLSPTIIGDWLRGRLGFSGVVVSDDLEMRAVADHYSVGEAAVEAVRAGSDIVLVCKTASLVREALVGLAAAIDEGRIGAAALAAAERRRRKLIQRVRKLAGPPVDTALIGAQEHSELASRFA
jgi:beta-N-acetylhexosaminidase